MSDVCTHNFPGCDCLARAETRYAAVVDAAPPAVAEGFLTKTEADTLRERVAAVEKDRDEYLGKLIDKVDEVSRLQTELGHIDATLARRSALDDEPTRAGKIEKAIRVAKDADNCKHSLNMYAKAWRRELGPYFRSKTHEIDALVVSTQDMQQHIRELQAKIVALSKSLGAPADSLPISGRTFGGNQGPPSSNSGGAA